jgi:hypothetical protein
MSSETFNPAEYIDGILSEMPDPSRTSEEADALRSEIGELLLPLVQQTIAEHVDPQVADRLMENEALCNDFQLLTIALIHNSPETQLELTRTLENFRSEILDTFKSL